MSNASLSVNANTHTHQVSCMIDMINQHVVPSMKKAGLATTEIAACVITLEKVSASSTQNCLLACLTEFQ